MNLEILGAIAALVVSLLSGLGIELFGSKIERKLFPKSNNQEVYSEKLKEITSSLEESSKEMDSLIDELSSVAKEREERVKKIETDLTKLQNREVELKERIESLQNVPLPVAEYFAELTSQGEKRSAKRDYLLFGAGAVVSTAITIILKLVFGI
jgi:DNA repair exonuclease SbcCD ATPase subunit